MSLLLKKITAANKTSGKMTFYPAGFPPLYREQSTFLLSHAKTHRRLQHVLQAIQ